MKPNRAEATAGVGRGRAREGEGLIRMVDRLVMIGDHWPRDLQYEKAQVITLYGARCYMTEDLEGGVWILAPLAKVAPRKSYEAEDVPNARTRT